MKCVEQGAHAEPPLVDGDPVASIKLVENPAMNSVVVTKTGKVRKNRVR